MAVKWEHKSSLDALVPRVCLCVSVFASRSNGENLCSPRTSVCSSSTFRYTVNETHALTCMYRS